MTERWQVRRESAGTARRPVTGISLAAIESWSGGVAAAPVFLHRKASAFTVANFFMTGASSPLKRGSDRVLGLAQPSLRHCLRLGPPAPLKRRLAALA
jgi:hypothetical protein